MTGPLDGAKPTGLRSRRREQLIADVRSIAMRQFDEFGYEETSLRSICDEADISLRTLFRHFKGKDDILAWRIADWAERIQAAFADQPSEMPLIDAYLAAVSDVIESDVGDNRAEAASVMRLLDEVPSIRGKYFGSASGHGADEMHIEIARRLGVEPIDPRVRLVRSFISAAVAQALADWANETDSAPLGALLHAYLKPIGLVVNDIRGSLDQGQEISRTTPPKRGRTR